MKFSVSSYSFKRMFDRGELNQLFCIKKAAEIGFDAVEFVDIQPHNDMPKEEYVKQLKDECLKYVLEISNYTFHADFLNGSLGDTDAEVRRVCKEIEYAVLLGAKSIRHDVTRGYINCGGYKGFDNALPVLSKACRQVTQYAKELGIKTMMENHGFFCQDSRRVEKLVNTVADDNFGILCDMGNFLCADEDPCMAVGRVAPYTVYVHAKDFIMKNGYEPYPGDSFFKTRAGNYLRGTIIGHGVVQIKQCMSILKANGYDGTVAIEFEGSEETIPALREGLANLKSYSS